MKNFGYFFVNSAILSVFVALCVNSDENIAQSTDKSEDSNMVLPIPDFLSVTTVSTIDNCTNATSGICNNVDNNTSGNENQSIELIPLSHHSNVTTVSNSTTNASSEDIDNSTQYLLDRAAASAKPETGDPLLINSNTSVASVINKIYSNYFWMPDDSDRLGKKNGIKKSNSTVNRTNTFSHTFSNGTKVYKYQNKSAGQPANVPGRAIIILTGEIPTSIDFTTSNVSEIDEKDFISNPEIDALMTDYVTKQIDSIVTENITNFDNETKDGTRNENNTNANINGTKIGNEINNSNVNITGSKDGIRYVCNDSASDTKLNVWKVVNSLADILLSEVLKRNNETGTTPSKRVQDGTESDGNSDESHENKGVDETDASDGEEAGTVSADESTDDDTKDTSFEEPDSLSISEESNKNKNADSSSSDQDTIESEEGKTDSESEEGKKDTDNDNEDGDSSSANVSVGEKAGTVSDDKAKHSSEIEGADSWTPVSKFSSEETTPQKTKKRENDCEKNKHGETTPQKTNSREPNYQKNKYGEPTPDTTDSREPNYQKNKYGEPTPETADSRETNYQKNRYAEPTPDTTDSRETTNYQINKYGETAPQQTNSRKPNYQKNQYGEPTPESTNSRETNYQKNKYGENKRQQKNRYGEPTPETSTSQETNYQKNKYGENKHPKNRYGEPTPETSNSGETNYQKNSYVQPTPDTTNSRETNYQKNMYGESNHRKNRYEEPSSDTRNSQESNNQKNRYVQPTPDTTDSRETNYQKNKYEKTNYQRIKNKDANFGKTTSEETTTDKSDDEYYIKFGLPKISNPRYTKYAHNPFASGLGFLKQKQVAEKPTTVQNFHDSTPPTRDSPPKSDNSVRQAHSSATVAPDVDPGYYFLI